MDNHLHVRNIPRPVNHQERALTTGEVISYSTELSKKLLAKPRDPIRIVDDADHKLIESTFAAITANDPRFLYIGADLSQRGLKTALTRGGHDVISLENEGLSKFELTSADYSLGLLMRTIRHDAATQGINIFGESNNIGETPVFEDLSRNLVPGVAEMALIENVSRVRSVMQFKETLPDIFVETQEGDGNSRVNFVETRRNLFHAGIVGTLVDQIEENYGSSARDFVVENYPMIQLHTRAPAFICDYSLGRLAEEYGFSLPVILSNNAIISLGSKIQNLVLWTRTGNPKSLPLLQTAYQWGLPEAKAITPDLEKAVKTVQGES